MSKLRPILKARRAASVKRSEATAAVRSVMALRAMKAVREADRPPLPEDCPPASREKSRPPARRRERSRPA